MKIRNKVNLIFLLLWVNSEMIQQNGFLVTRKKYVQKFVFFFSEQQKGCFKFRKGMTENKNKLFCHLNNNKKRQK